MYTFQQHTHAHIRLDVFGDDLTSHHSTKEVKKWSRDGNTAIREPVVGGLSITATKYIILERAQMHKNTQCHFYSRELQSAVENTQSCINSELPLSNVQS